MNARPINMMCCHTEYPLRQTLKKAGVVVAGVGLLGVLFGCSVPLLNASASGDTQTVRSLLRSGHNANEVFPVVGTQPLMVAAANGHIETVKALLDAGADVNAEDLTGWTALHAGAFHGDASIVSLLLERGAVSGKARWFLASPLAIAEMLDHKEIIPLLHRIESPLASRDAPSSQ